MVVVFELGRWVLKRSMGRTNWKHASTGRDETLRVGEEKDPSLGFIGPLNLDLTLPLGAAPLLLFNDDFAFDVG